MSAFPASQLILPFTMQLLVNEFWLVLSCCYLYESLEALLKVFLAHFAAIWRQAKR